MPKVSVNLLTKNRAALLPKALASITAQSFSNYEVVIVNDGSSDNTADVLKDLALQDFKIISHAASVGITQSRQEALLASRGEYIAILDDDDEWIDKEKLKKQVEYLDVHQDCVLVGGGRISVKNEVVDNKFRPQSDGQIRRSMLFRNNFFTSTVMFRHKAALKAGGFIKDQDDFAEDYDLWLRMGKLGKMYNFKEVFTKYRLPDYNKEKYRSFLQKQLRLIKRHRKDYPHYFLASLVLNLRLFL